MQQCQASDTLPEGVVLNILSKLPSTIQACTGKLVCKAAHRVLKQTHVDATHPDIPLSAIQQKYAATRHIPWGGWVWPEARAKAGDLAALQWTHPARDETVYDAAAREGRLDMLQWLRAQDPPCPWDESVCRGAANGGLDVLQWLRAQEPPCPWNARHCAVLARSGPVQDWIRQQDDYVSDYSDADAEVVDSD